MKQTELVELVYMALGEPSLIKNIDLCEPHAVRFSWRGVPYRVSANLLVEKVDGRMLVSDCTSDVMGKLFKKTQEVRLTLV